IASPPASDLQLIVTIPCYKEPNLLHVLDTLKKCKLPLHKSVEVIVLINNAVSATEEIKQQNRMTFLAAQDWSNQYNTKDLQFHILYIDNLPDKHAGVGLARKIAMDEAIRRFHSLNRPNGIIACLDADSSVASNYFEALCNYFEKHINCPAVDIYYEHPLEGNDFNEKTYDAILDYELHLRYYVHALQKAGLTNATQTVGSAMAVRTIAYAKQGGMNRRKAGEDFYFLHKFTAFEDFGHLVSTTVFPSPRTSDRVPFGTGKAIHSILEGHVLTTYHPAIFSDLKVMLSGIENSYLQVEVNTWMDQLPLSIQQFFIQEDFALKWQELKQNTSNIRSFQKRFFQWFDAFKAMKYVH
ncbi:MAG: glycosyltransferase family 2 protein, partial [Bacteroidota bacterium]